MKNNNAQKEKWIGRHIKRTPVLVALALFLILSNSVIYLTAFEAHVVNVTATIERPPMMCNALSIGYWRNHEGCAGGEGESVWTDEINDLSGGSEFSDVFSAITSEEICEALWIPNCPSGNGYSAKLCKAKAMALADELNVVSGRLSLDALLSGADDGNIAFDHMYLNANSTVRDALRKTEGVIAGVYGGVSLTEAAYVAERIYAFYEDENPDAPYCVIDPIILLSGNSVTQSFDADNSDDSGSDEDDEQNEHEDGNKSEDTETDESNGRGRHENNEESEGAETDADATNTDNEINSSSTSSDEVINSETATSTEG